jgi:predicted nucleic acid-binding protein
LTPVVVDTNVLFSALLSPEARFRRILLGDTETRFYCCRFSLVELFAHKAKLLAASKLDESQLLEAMSLILGRLQFHDEISLSNDSVRRAWELCADVDEKDTPFVALTIELGALLWTGDKELKRGLAAKGFDRLFTPN